VGGVASWGTRRARWLKPNSKTSSEQHVPAVLHPLA
jgi:hypothetical protein